MATTVRGSSGGKEKRGTSPSSSIIKKSPKPSTSNPGSSPSSPTKEKTTAPTDGKPVPNYLKPTISSNLDFSRLPKKSSTDSSTQKPVANRRRSFDRPPPVSQVQKVVRNVPGPREVKPLRSSSFSHKSSTSSASSIRPASERPYARTTSTLKDGQIEQVLSKSRNLKKSTTLSSSITPTTKKGLIGTTSSSSSKKAPKSVTSESSIDHDNNLVVDQLVVEDDLISVENDVQSLPEISEMPDSNQELGDPTITFTDVEVKPVENVQDNLALSEQQNVHDDHKQEEQHDNQTVETRSEPENVQESSDDQNLTVEEQNQIVQEQNMTVEEQNMTVEEQNVTVEEQNVTVEEQSLTVESDEPQNVEVKETELAEEKKEERAMEQKPEKREEEQEAKVENQTVQTVSSPVSAPAKLQTASGKKDKQAYNDIIEQTSTKLMGGRKNKVLALAGAFETVISLQDTNKN